MLTLYILGGIWLADPVLSWLYILVLLPRDLKYVGWTNWYAVEFELISEHSWYAKLWRDWHGCSVWGAMVMRKADYTTMLHEGKHCKDRVLFGGYFAIAYIINSVFIWLFQKNKHAYYDNIWERRARKAAGQLVDIPRERWPHGKDDRWVWW